MLLLLQPARVIATSQTQIHTHTHTHTHTSTGNSDSDEFMLYNNNNPLLCVYGEGVSCVYGEGLVDNTVISSLYR